MHLNKILSFTILALSFPILASSSARALQVPEEFGAVGDFSLVNQDGKPIRKSDLDGKIWVANFVFTRCSGPCPMISSHMAQLRKKISSDVKLVSFSVDPEYDQPAVLAEYAARYGARAPDWSFATGGRKEVYDLLTKSFRIGLSSDENQLLTHSLKFVLVDENGRIRGYYDGEDPAQIKKIPFHANLLKMQARQPWVLRLPKLNAMLNAACAFFLIVGLRQILSRNVAAHRACMGAAFMTSILFLASYLTYHGFMGSKPFEGEGAVRVIYFTTLTSHSILAALIVPMALWTFRLALKEDFEKHRKLARWTWPVWMYVSVTGVAIYGMLYHF